MKRYLSVLLLLIPVSVNANLFNYCTGCVDFTPSTSTLLSSSTLVLSSNFIYTSTSPLTLAVTPAGDGVLPSTYSYAYRKTLTIDKTKVSPTNATTLTNFPVLVSMTSTDLATSANNGHVANASGFDIVFSTMPDCSYLLNWDTETYTASTGNLIAWVKMPSLAPAVNTVFYMCYGRSATTSYQGSSTNTWTNNYEGVFHLGSSLAVESSSHTLTATNTGVTSATGQIGNGGSFAKNQFMTSGGTADYNLVSSGTTSGWINTTANATFNPMIAKGDLGSDRNGYDMTVNTSNNKIFMDMCSASAAQQFFGTNVVSQGAWHYLAVTWNGATINYFIDGVLDAHQAQTVTPFNTATTLHLGSDSSGVFTSTSTMDELHLSLTPRTTDWLITEFNNQNSPSTFMTTSSENTLYSGHIALLNVPNTWSAPQTFSSATILNGPITFSSNVVMNSTWGAVGQVFKSSSGAAPYWGSFSTATNHQIILAAGTDYLVGDASFTYKNLVGGQMGAENLGMLGSGPAIIFKAQNAQAIQFFNSTGTNNSDMYGAIVEHPNTTPGSSQGVLNIYQRDGGNIFMDVTGQGSQNSQSFQVRVAAQPNEATPYTILQVNATHQFLIAGGYVSVDSGDQTKKYLNQSTATMAELRSSALTTYNTWFSSTSANFQVAISTMGHIVTYGNTPVISACGVTPSGSVVGDDNQGTITVGGGAVTSCTLTFGSTWGATPTCVLTSNSTAVTTDISAISATAFTINSSLSLGGGIVWYRCGCSGLGCI